MKIFLVTIVCAAMTAASSQAQTIWSYNFDGTGSLSTGSSTNSYVASPSGGGTNIFRVGSGGGSFNLATSSFGTGNSLIATAPTNQSFNKFTVFNWVNPTEIYSMKFDLRLSGGSSGAWYLFSGNGTSFESGTAGFTGSQSFSGIKLTYGAAGAITVSNRAVSSWAAINGTGLAQDQNFSLAIYGNNSASSVTYNGNLLASNTYDLWIDNTLVAAGLGKAQLANVTAIDSFMFYGESSTGNVATLELDNLQYANYAIPEPSSSMLIVLGAAGLIGIRAMRRKDS